MKPYFSIITVTKNTEEKIDLTIKSVLSQSFKNFEYLIVDGNSTDSTFDKINRYKQMIMFGSKDAVGESLDDTFKDISVYGIIAQLVQSGKWGK